MRCNQITMKLLKFTGADLKTTYPKQMNHTNQADMMRFQPTESALKIILNNKVFPDDLLDEDRKIDLIVTQETNPVLHFHFKQAYLDFRVILDAELLANPVQGWMQTNPIEIQLVLSDSIFADQLQTRAFKIKSSHLKPLINILLNPK